MKVTVNDKEDKKERSFPKLMTASSGAIYLMIDRRSGVTVKKGNDVTVGRYYDCLLSDSMIDYEGSITLEND